jgi:hypothetical protein
LGEARGVLKTLAENDPDQRVRFAAKEALAGLADAPVGPGSPRIVAPKQD